METLCRLSYRGNERNLRQIGFADANPLTVASLTAAPPLRAGSGCGHECAATMVAGEGFEPP